MRALVDAGASLEETNEKEGGKTVLNYAIQTMMPKCVEDVLDVDRQGVLLRRTFRVGSTLGATREVTPLQQVKSMRNAPRETQDNTRSMLENALHSVVKSEKEEEAKKAGVKKGGGGRVQGTAVQGTRKRSWQYPEEVEAMRRASSRPKREVSDTAGGDAGGGGGGSGGGAGVTTVVKERRAAQCAKKGKELKSDSYVDKKAGGDGGLDKQKGPEKKKVERKQGGGGGTGRRLKVKDMPTSPYPLRGRGGREGGSRWHALFVSPPPLGKEGGGGGAASQHKKKQLPPPLKSDKTDGGPSAKAVVGPTGVGWGGSGGEGGVREERGQQIDATINRLVEAKESVTQRM